MPNCSGLYGGTLYQCSHCGWTLPWVERQLGANLFTAPPDIVPEHKAGYKPRVTVTAVPADYSDLTGKGL